MSAHDENSLAVNTVAASSITPAATIEPVTETFSPHPTIPAQESVPPTVLPEILQPVQEVASSTILPEPRKSAPESEFPMVQPPAQLPVEEPPKPETATAPVVEVQVQSVAPAVVHEEIVREETGQPEVVAKERVMDERKETVSLPVSLNLDWSTDLIQVETNAEKYRIALTKVQEEQPGPRQQRVRPPLPPVSDVPLIQVETSSSAGAIASPPAT
jgi:hypothetical protein